MTGGRPIARVASGHTQYVDDTIAVEEPLEIRAVVADASVASVLQVEVGSPLLSVERLSYTYGDQPVELRRGLYRTDRHYYRNELS